MNTKIKRLEELYANKSRHSQYQILASNIEHLVTYKKPQKSKYEKARLDYILKRVDLHAKSILDIGGNTGYFTFESCNSNPKSIDFFEGNKEHAEFVQLASDMINASDIIKVYPKYFDFEKQNKMWDVVYCLNVIHHIGFDFDKEVSADAVKEKILEYINRMAEYAKILVFQMGYNWYGDIQKCLFVNGTKEEMEMFIQNGTKNYWEIEHIGIPEKRGNDYIYEEKTKENNIRIDEYGEFLNRPLFILKSRLI